MLTPPEHRAGDEPARDTLAFLTESRGLALQPLSREDVTTGLALYRREDDIEVVDCFMVAYMRRVGLEYLYSFDDDFDRFEDISRLDTAANPFGE